jgi:hypothetical protein
VAIKRTLDAAELSKVMLCLHLRELASDRKIKGIRLRELKMKGSTRYAEEEKEMRKIREIIKRREK